MILNPPFVLSKWQRGAMGTAISLQVTYWALKVASIIRDFMRGGPV
ncbi:hypothetical protein [Micromonospora sp. WMMD737]